MSESGTDSVGNSKAEANERLKKRLEEMGVMPSKDQPQPGEHKSSGGFWRTVMIIGVIVGLGLIAIKQWGNESDGDSLASPEAVLGAEKEDAVEISGTTDSDSIVSSEAVLGAEKKNAVEISGTTDSGGDAQSAPIEADETKVEVNVVSEAVFAKTEDTSMAPASSAIHDFNSNVSKTIPSVEPKEAVEALDKPEPTVAEAELTPAVEATFAPRPAKEALQPEKNSTPINADDVGGQALAQAKSRIPEQAKKSVAVYPRNIGRYPLYITPYGKQYPNYGYAPRFQMAPLPMYRAYMPAMRGGYPRHHNMNGAVQKMDTINPNIQIPPRGRVQLSPQVVPYQPIYPPVRPYYPLPPRR